jgi:hypothetical protein
LGWNENRTAKASAGKSNYASTYLARRLPRSRSQNYEPSLLGCRTELAEESMVKRLGLLGIVLFAVSAAPVRAADVTGDWRVTISTPDGAMTGKASFKQNGDAVTGWVGPSENDPIPISGTLQGNKLTIKTAPQPGRTAAFDKCDVTVDRDKMTGTIDTDKGTIEFVRSVRPASRKLR